MKRIVLLATAATLLLGCCALADVYTFRSYNEYPVNDKFNLRISNTAGSINIERSQSPLLIIDAEKKIQASNRRDAERLEREISIDVDAKPNRVQIQTHYPDFSKGDSFWEKLLDIKKDDFGYVDYYIKVPSEVDIEVSSTSGSVVIVDQTGEIEISVTSGDTRIRNLIGDITITSTSGNIDIAEVYGNVEVRSTSSDALIENVTGNLSFRSTSGRTEVYGLAGNVDLRKTSGDSGLFNVLGNIEISTTSGKIELEQEEGALRISSQSSDVEITTTMLNGDKYVAETISGSIDFKIPVGVDSRIDLETVSGTINTNLPLTVRSFSDQRLSGELGAGGPRIELSSISGDIKLEEK